MGKKQKTKVKAGKVRASHILIPKLSLAQEIKTKIDNGENFSALAKEYSECPSKKRGGDLGEFGRGQMVKEFETATYNLSIGQISDPIKTKFGYHIIKRMG